MSLIKAVAIPAAAIAAAAIGTPAAFAATTYTVTAGSATTADNPINWHASTTGDSPQVTFNDVDAGVTMTCDSATAAGQIDVGGGQSGSGVATINDPDPTNHKTEWFGCQGLGLTLHVAATLPWNIDATGPTSGGVTPVEISGIVAHVNDDNGLCSFDVTGSVPGSYDNATQDLAVNGGGLTIGNVGGSLCPVLLGNDEATYQATYHVDADNASFDPIQVTSE